MASAARTGVSVTGNVDADVDGDNEFERWVLIIGVTVFVLDCAVEGTEASKSFDALITEKEGTIVCEPKV